MKSNIIKTISRAASLLALLLLTASTAWADNDFTFDAVPNPESYGTVTGAGDYNCGETATLEAIPAEGYHFVNWTNPFGFTVSTNNPFGIRPNMSATYVANFAINTYTLTLEPNPQGKGTVTIDGELPDGVIDNHDGTYTVNHGTEVNIIATPNEHYHLAGWSNIGGNDLQQSVTVTQDLTISANFAIDSYAIGASVTPEGAGSVSGAETYNHGTTVTLTATPNAGYQFVNWTEDNSVVSADATYTFTAESPRMLVANFEPITITAGALSYEWASGTNVKVTRCNRKLHKPDICHHP